MAAVEFDQSVDTSSADLRRILAGSLLPRLRDELLAYAERCDREALELEQRAWQLQEEAKQVTEVARGL